jgi:ELWxxDGT repeat protein
MKKKTFLFLLLSCFVAGGAVSGQSLPDGMVKLLPEGVTAAIDGNERKSEVKNLVVAGEESKGYKAFFAADDGTHGQELWVTDGTAEGTMMVKDINPGAGSSNVSYLARFNDKVVFSADDGEHGEELWISDGTEDGTYMVMDIHLLDSSNPLAFKQVNETQFVFAAMDLESELYGNQKWLWVSDGTEAGTELIYECKMMYPGQDSGSYDDHLCRVGRKVFFKADDLESSMGGELWVTDGTAEGTKLIMDINLEAGAEEGQTRDSAIDQMVNFYNERLFFKAWQPDFGNEPWASDGTTEGTYMIFDSDPTKDPNGIGRGGNVWATGGPYNGKVYFRGYTPETGYELAFSNTDKDNFGIIDINKTEPTNNNNSFPDPGVVFDGVLMFCANSGNNAAFPETNFGGELHYTDGENVYLQYDLAPGTMNTWARELTVASGSLYFWNSSDQVPEHKEKLMRLDSKNGIPVPVTNLNPDGDKVKTLRNLGGDILFITSDNKQLYNYHYRKPGYDAEKDADHLDIEFRTRDEIANSVFAPKAGKTLSVYPNPAVDAVNFDIAETVIGVRILDITGRTVKNEIPSANSIDVSALSGGIYSLVITTVKGQYVSSLIVK